MSAATPHGQTPYYFVPAPSRHPVLAATGLLFVILGAGQWINGHEWGMYSLIAGFVLWAFVLQQWFREAIGESEGGLYSERIDVSFRWSMSWFIFSEVMFFGAFFGALFWTRLHALPSLGSLENAVLWPDFRAVWPSAGGGTGSPAGIVDPFTTMGPWPIPTINTLLLLTSGVTLTIAHHALVAGQHRRAVHARRPLAAADGEHGAAADLGRHADDRAPRADREQAREGDRLDVVDRAARCHLPRLPDL